MLPALNELILGVDQRFCMRHLYENFRKKFLGKILKHLMWMATYCTHPQAWEKVMLEIKEVNEDAFKHLIVIPPRQVFGCLLTWSIFSFGISYSDSWCKLINLSKKNPHNGMINLNHNTLQLQIENSKKNPHNNVQDHTVRPAIRDVPESIIAAQPPSHNPVK